MLRVSPPQSKIADTLSAILPFNINHLKITPPLLPLERFLEYLETVKGRLLLFSRCIRIQFI